MRRVFVSAGPDGERRVNELAEMAKDAQADLEFIGRHQVEEAEDSQLKYVDRRVKEKIWACSVTLFFLEEDIQDSAWIDKELMWSLDKNPSNGVVGVLLEGNAEVPDMLKECGAEIVRWDPSLIPSAIERAARAAGRAAEPPKTGPDEEVCARESA